jgi:hypothetical protein
MNVKKQHGTKETNMYSILSIYKLKSLDTNQVDFVHIETLLTSIPAILNFLCEPVGRQKEAAAPTCPKYLKKSSLYQTTSGIFFFVFEDFQVGVPNLSLIS